jgi:hypothetical protein
MKKFQYLECCVNSDAESIDGLTESAIPITLSTMRRHCDITELEKNLSYNVGGQRGGLRLKDDWHVSYYKGVYRGQKCYFLVHSAIEYIFTEQS